MKGRSLSAMWTSSTSEPASIFCMTRERWTLIVFSLVPSSRADLLVEQPGHDQAEDLPLAGSERLEPGPEHRLLRAFGAALTVALQGAPDGAKQRLVREGLLQEVHGAALHGADAARDVRPAADEDDRDVEAPFDEEILEIQAAQAGHAQVRP